MLPAERRNHILKMLNKNSKIEIEVVAVELNVSPMTIRRDLALLEEQGLAYRTHGGAVLYNGLHREVPYKSKETTNIDEKERIGREARKLIKEGYTLILDAGTTTLAIARAIKEVKNLTVITNDLKIALELNDDSDANVYCLGGLVQKGLGITLGSEAQDFLSNIRVDICFLAAPAIDLDWGITNPSMEKANLKKKMIKVADQIILVTDHTKFYKKAFVHVADLKDIDVLITDSGVDSKTIEAIRSLGIDTRIV
ncbi:MAG: DeoR/GlpR family DNA-binding transcription regulator [Desulfitobacterium hafniense]|nr:DeoR/GlpR family DNA-binding transcription regulator [Desulfitobacterium hafniense]